MKNKIEGMFSTRETADHIGVSTVTIKIWVKKGKLENGQMIGNTRYYDQSVIKAYKKNYILEKTTRNKGLAQRKKKAYETTLRRKQEVQDRIDNSDIGIDILGSELSLMTGLSSSKISKLVSMGAIEPIGVIGKRDLFDSNLITVLAVIDVETHTPQWILDMREERDNDDYYKPRTNENTFIWKKPDFTPVQDLTGF